MSNLTKEWGAYMAFTGAAPLTVETRTRALRKVERERGDLLTLTTRDVIAYLAAYQKAPTRATLLSYIKCFYAWAVDQGLLEENPTDKIPKIKVPGGEPRPAPVEDIQAMMAKAEPRTRAMALLMMYAGLRSCEVAPFRKEHLRQSADGRWWVDIPRSKGGHHQSVPIPADAAGEILAAPGWDIGPQAVRNAISKAFREVGSPCTGHQLRHYFGTSALQSTQNLRKVQEMMRHASPATTARYTKVTPSELSDAAEGLPRIA